MVIRIWRVASLLPLYRCIARFRVVIWVGELGISPLSYLENPVVTTESAVTTYSAVTWREYFHPTEEQPFELRKHISIAQN